MSEVPAADMAIGGAQSATAAAHDLLGFVREGGFDDPFGDGLQAIVHLADATDAALALYQATTSDDGTAATGRQIAAAQRLKVAVTAFLAEVQ